MQLPSERIGVMEADGDNNCPDGTQALPELWAPYEVCAAFGWSRVRFMREREKGFPRPVMVVANGSMPLWIAADVRAWASQRGAAAK